MIGAIAANRRRGGAAFDPADLFADGSIGGWWDPSDLSTLWQDSAGTVPAVLDGPVARISDRSGNGVHLVQAAPASQAILRGDGMRNWIEFDRVDDHYAAGDMLDLGGGGYFAVGGARAATAGDNMGLYSKAPYATVTARFGLLLRDGGSVRSVYSNPTSGSSVKSVAWSSTSDQLVAVKLDRAAGINRVRLNGVTQTPDASFAPNTATMNSSYQLRVGTYGNSNDTGPNPGYFFGGRLYGLIIKLAPIPSDGEIGAAEEWMATRMGLAL